ncbi:vacuolar protein sorting-associated protein 33B [Musca vetustissima]|uniref:vacuolar protein sorting-associated protein 33B n=1 Tax=Musca vetustissima TaxID=27455 RepID=UPI002AB74423|nr:vacuolar protein sorting-associated protein 33B [Musca vetustissima]
MQSSSLDKKLQGFQLIAQEKLQAILCSIPGKKDLIIEPNLIKPLEHICAASWLKLKGIQRIFKLDSNNAITRSSDQVQLYMIRSDLNLFYRIMDQIKLIRSTEAQSSMSDDASFKYYHIICVPSCFGYFVRLLEHEGLYGVVGLHRFSWDFIYLDEGLLSMEVQNVFSTAFMRSDCSLIPTISHSLRVLHLLCGRPNIILTYGAHSENILKMLNNLGSLPKKSNDNNEPDFSTMLIIDRDKDFASPLLTPAIYSGLLLEVFNSNAGMLELDLNKNKILQEKLSIFSIPPSKRDKEAKPNKNDQKNIKPTTIRLSGMHDEIYAENRYKHFAAASSQIRQQAKSISMELQKLNNMKLDEMHDYVNRKLPKITEMKTKLLRHLNASEKVIEMLGSNYRRVQSLEEDILNNVSRKKILGDIDELLTTDGHKYNILRLLCLLHVCAGITSDELSQFIRNYCNYFGLKYLVVFQNLSQIGLLPTPGEETANILSTPLNKKATKLLSNIPLNIPKFQQTQFQANANRLKLMVSTAGAEEMDNISMGSSSSASISTTGSTTMSNTTACPSYVFNRLYIPLVAQLCSFLLKSSNVEELVTKLSMIEQIQINGQSIKSYSQSVKQGNAKDLPLKNRNIFVYLVGGITYAEIAACNLISKLTESQVFVASDCILSGSELIAGAFNGSV